MLFRRSNVHLKCEFRLKQNPRVTSSVAMEQPYALPKETALFWEKYLGIFLCSQEIFRVIVIEFPWLPALAPTTSLL